MLMPARVLPTFTLAHAIGGGERLGDGIHQLVVGAGGALVHERRKAADEIDAHFGPSAIHGPRDGGEVVGGYGGADLSNGGDRNALVHDGDAELALELLGGGHQALGGRGHAVVHLARQRIHVGVHAAAQVDAQRDGADVQVLLGHHGQCLGNLGGGNLHNGSSCSSLATNSAAFPYSHSVANGKAPRAPEHADGARRLMGRAAFRPWDAYQPKVAP